jgi:hypothetical protein
VEGRFVTTDLETDGDASVWFLLLERGRLTGDFELAARAKRALLRLGISVAYTNRVHNAMEQQSHVHPEGDPADAR